MFLSSLYMAWYHFILLSAPSACEVDWSRRTFPQQWLSAGHRDRSQIAQKTGIRHFHLHGHVHNIHCILRQCLSKEAAFSRCMVFCVAYYSSSVLSSSTSIGHLTRYFALKQCLACVFICLQTFLWIHSEHVPSTSFSSTHTASLVWSVIWFTSYVDY